MQYFVIALGVALLIALLTVDHLFGVNEDLKKEIARLETNKAVRSVEIQECKQISEYQNTEISKLTARYGDATKRYEKLRAQPERVRYEKIYEIKEMRSDECEDIKRGVDLLRDIRVGM